MLLYQRLGRDANGSSLVSEHRQLLDEEGITEAGERAAYRDLWAAMDAAHAEVTREQMPSRKRED